MKSSWIQGWLLNPRTSVLITENRGRFETHIQGVDGHMKTEAQIGGKELQAKECQGFLGVIRS